MLFFLYLPEVVAFLEFLLVSTQEMPFGALLVLAQFGLFALLAITHPAAFVRVVLRWWPLLLVQIIAVASAAWSPLPSETARYAMQFLYTAMLGVMLAQVMTPRRFLSVLLVALFVFCILCVLYGRQGPSFYHMVLVGLTGSKNQLAYEAQLLMIAAIAVLMLRDISVPMRWVALLSAPLAGYLLIETESSTAMVTAALGGVALIGLAVCHRLTPGGRVAALAGAIVVMLPLLALLPEINGAINHFVFDTLNKDPTLSGRTALWARADDLIARRPLFGYGYQAIWMGDSTETIALRRLTGILDSRVFHFHHQFRQIAIDTGIVGLLAFIGVLITVGFASMRKFLLQPSIETTFFFLVFMLMVARGFVDLIVGPFSIHTIVFYAACVYALRQASQPARAEHGPTQAHWIQRAALSRLR